MKKAAFKFQLSGFAFLLMAVLSTASAEMLVGGLPGDVNVDNTGEATYSIPLSLPPGTAGMAPTLGVAYSSTGGNGLLGLGFSLNGLSGVSRSPSTRLHDGVIDGVDFDDLDRLVLDGQRLMLVSTGSYGSAESEYRTEIESFSKIALHGGMNSAESWFEVHTKSGLIYEYGHTADSFVEPEGRTNAVRWAVNKISDTAGNYIAFNYSENANEPHLLTNIAYTGNAGQSLSPCNEIDFVYEDRDDIRSGYMAGSKMISNKRLQKVEISGASGHITDYRFVYEYNEVGLSLLTSVQQFFGSDDIPKTLFDYTEKTNADTFAYTSGTAFIPDGAENDVYRDTSPARVDSGDFNGDGIIDFLRLDNKNNPKYSWIGIANGDGTFTYTSGTNFITFGSSTNLYHSDKMQTMLPDFNGDGLSDILCIDPNNTSGSSWIGLATGDTNFFTYLNGTNCIPNGALNNVYRDGNTIVQSGDFNGDGLADIVSVYPDDNFDQASDKSWIGLSNGDGTFSFTSGTNFLPYGGLNNIYMEERTVVFVSDFNGDGLSDIASVYPDDNFDDASGKSWIGLSNGDGTFAFTSGTNFLPYGGQNNVYMEERTTVFSGDFNGDGLADMVSVYPDSSASKSWIALSKGNGTFNYLSGTNFIPDGSSGNVYRDSSTSAFAADVNGDGLSDLISIYPNNTTGKSWIGISTGDGTFTYVNGTEFIPEGAANNVYRDSSTVVSAGDFNGDGMLDIASVYPGNNASKSWIALNLNKRCMLSKATKGYRSASEHGSVTEIEYLPITDDLIYTKGTGAEYPVYDVQAPIYVVSALTKDNGIGGKYYSDFTYADARTHRDRGFLGFNVFESYDRQTHLSQVEILAQDFPQTGSSLRQETYYFPDPNDLDSKQLLKEVNNTYLYDRVNHGGTATNYSLFSYVAKSVEKKWELGETDTNNTMTEVTSYNWFDDQSLTNGAIPRLTQTNETGEIIAPGDITYGNITKIVMDYGDGAMQISSNSYFMGGIDNWLLGRLATSTVTHVLSGKPSVTRTSCFDYDATSGLLCREVVEPTNTVLALTTDYAYDGFGNITNKTVSAPGIVTRSVQQSDYAAGGRFVSASRNILGHGETYQYDQNTGLVLSKTGPNGLSTSMEYDPLGRAIRETRADGTTTTTEYAWLDNTTVTTPDPLNPGSNFTSKVSYRVTTQSSGSAPVTAWYDNQGRELRKIGLSPSGKTVYQDTGYNGVGQPVVTSEPYFPGEEIKYTHTEYDVLGRARYLISPNGTVMETVYNGLTTQSIADSNHRTTGETPKHQVKTVIQNAQGQTLQVIDNLNNSLTYEYDAVGNLTATEDPNGNRIEMEYDLLGKKIMQDDPDMGVWHYQYNALGELVSQTDAASNRVENAYDTLGRIVARTNWVMRAGSLDLESTAAWYYDGTDAGCWLGALRREELRDGDGNLTYRKTYAYDSYGRPMLELYNFDNKWYYNCVRYDQYSRVKFTDRFWRPKAVMESGDNLSPLWNVLSTVNTYNNLGVVTKVSDSTGHTWWQIDDRDVDSRGRLLKYTLGNGTVTTKDYDSDTGFLTAIKCRNASSASDDIQSQLYTFDRLGNITSRQDLRQIHLKETFVNDGLNRLTSSTVESSLTNSVATALTYDNQGNILTKTGVGDYSYGQGGAKPHAVTSVSSVSSVVNYSYDANGNMCSRTVGTNDTLTTVWNSFNKPKTMFSGLNGSTFTYDINNSRITQIIETDTGLAKTVKKKIYIAGMEQDEQVTNPDDGRESWQWAHKETRIFINTPSGTVGIHVETPNSQPGTENSITRKYFHTDHLGSIVAVTGEKIGDEATRLAEYSFDAWGKRRNPTDWAPLQGSGISGQESADRGFTGHEMLDHLGLVHMNGRIYDANLGRFLSADPTLQFPDNLQDYNRYSYVGNNPLRYTDPSGYSWVGKILGKIKSFSRKYHVGIATVNIACYLNEIREKVWDEFKPYIGMVVSIAFTLAGMPFLGAIIGSAIQTIIDGGTLKGFLIGMAIGIVAGGVGGPMAGQVGTAIGLASRHLAMSILRGAMVGAIASITSAAVYGQNIWKAAAYGIAFGAATSAVVHLYRSYQTERFIENNLDIAEDHPDPEAIRNAVRDAGQSPLGQKSFGKFIESGRQLSILAETDSGGPYQLGGDKIYFNGNIQQGAIGPALRAEVWGPSMDDATVLLHEMGHTPTVGAANDDCIGNPNVSLNENPYRAWMGKTIRTYYHLGASSSTDPYSLVFRRPLLVDMAHPWY
jgi:RHS repeat-associated protein